MWPNIILTLFYVAAIIGLLTARRGIAFSLIVGAAVFGWIFVGCLLIGIFP